VTMFIRILHPGCSVGGLLKMANAFYQFSMKNADLVVLEYETQLTICTLRKIFNQLTMFFSIPCIFLEEMISSTDFTLLRGVALVFRYFRKYISYRNIRFFK
jgi:hypothetical protein